MIKVNFVGEELVAFREQLMANDGYCPCSIVHIPDTKCMCKEFRDKLEGNCHCGLYSKYGSTREVT